MLLQEKYFKHFNGLLYIHPLLRWVQVIAAAILYPQLFAVMVRVIDVSN